MSDSTNPETSHTADYITDYAFRLRKALLAVIREGSIGWWLDTAHPSELGGLSPAEALMNGRYEEVMAVALSYSDTSFT